MLILAGGVYFANTKLHFVSKIRHHLPKKENIVFVDINKPTEQKKDEKTQTMDDIESSIKPTPQPKKTKKSAPSKKTYITPKKDYIVIPQEVSYAKEYCTEKATTNNIQDNLQEKKETCENTTTPSTPVTTIINTEKKEVCEKYPCKKPHCNNIKVYNIEYTDAKALCKFINRNLKHKRGQKIAVLKAPNQIILCGNKEEICLAEAVINKLDEKPQVATFRVEYTNPCKMAKMLSYTIFDGKKEVKQIQSMNKYHNGQIVNDIYFNNEQNTITINGATSRQLELAHQFIKLTDKCPVEAEIELAVISFAQDTTSKFKEISSQTCNQKHFMISTNDFDKTLNELAKVGGGNLILKTTRTLKNNQSCQINLYEELNKAEKVKRYEKNLLEQVAMKITISPLISFHKQTFLSINPNYSFIKKTTKRVFDTDKSATIKSLNLKNIHLYQNETIVISCDTFSQDYIKRNKLRNKSQKLVILAKIKAN